MNQKCIDGFFLLNPALNVFSVSSVIRVLSILIELINKKYRSLYTDR